MLKCILCSFNLFFEGFCFNYRRPGLRHAWVRVSEPRVLPPLRGIRGWVPNWENYIWFSTHYAPGAAIARCFARPGLAQAGPRFYIHKLPINRPSGRYFYFILFYFILFYAILCYSIVFHVHVLSSVYFVLFLLIVYFFCFMEFHFTLFGFMLFLLLCLIMFYFILLYFMLHELFKFISFCYWLLVCFVLICLFLICFIL